VNPGKHTVSIAVLGVLACFAARDAGNALSDEPAALELGWAEALESVPAKAEACSGILTDQPARLVFERISLDEADAGHPELLASHAREVVNFEWNAATGELSYRTTTATKIFSDLEHSSTQAASLAGPSCVSR
jgi:hypothetical protein